MKLLTVIITSLVLLGVNALACAADQPTPFDQANMAFAQKDYGRAASDFQAIITRQGYSAPVLFNLANAYYRNGQLGLAILNYQRAQLLAPGDVDIAHNLHLARDKAGLADRPTVWFYQASHIFSLNAWSWFCGTVILSIAVGIVLRQFTQRKLFGWRTGMTISVCLLFATILALGVQWPEVRRGIITVKNTPVYISPVTVGQPLYTLVEGQAVGLRNVHGEFMLIETSDGHRGWVKRADVSPLIPTTHEAQIASR